MANKNGEAASAAEEANDAARQSIDAALKTIKVSESSMDKARAMASLAAERSLRALQACMKVAESVNADKTETDEIRKVLSNVESTAKAAAKFAAGKEDEDPLTATRIANNGFTNMMNKLNNANADKRLVDALKAAGAAAKAVAQAGTFVWKK